MFITKTVPPVPPPDTPSRLGFDTFDIPLLISRLLVLVRSSIFAVSNPPRLRHIAQLVRGIILHNLWMSCLLV